MYFIVVLKVSVIDTLLYYMPMFLSLQTMDQVSFWQGDDLICWSRDSHGFQYFPSLTISLAASANETIRLILSPQQYLRLASDSEQLSIDPDHDCFRVSIAPSDSGLYFSFITFLCSRVSLSADLTACSECENII